MKAGLIWLCEGGFDELDSFSGQKERNETVFSRSLQVRDRKHLVDGTTVYSGEAAVERVEENQSVTIDPKSGKISVVESPEREAKYTEFIAVPDKFVAVSSSKDIFGFELLREALPGVSIRNAKLDLNEFAEDYYTAEGVNPWQVGFYGNTGSAEKGAVYGEDVFDDQDIGEILERSQLNQLGLTYEYNGERMKMTSAESGYIEVYQPSNYTDKDYAEYIVDHICKYMKKK
jgi:hypothetical protein